MKLLVLMTAKNRPEYTERTLKSLRETCPQNTTFSIWHNGEMTPDMDYFLIDLKENLFYSRNDLGWEKGTNAHILNYTLNDYDYVLLTENDIEYNRGWFETCSSLLEKSDTIGVLSVLKENDNLSSQLNEDLMSNSKLFKGGWMFKSSRLTELFPITDDVSFCKNIRDKKYLITTPTKDLAIRITK